jgi:hypothetical protein
MGKLTQVTQTQTKVTQTFRSRRDRDLRWGNNKQTLESTNKKGNFIKTTTTFKI